MTSKNSRHPMDSAQFTWMTSSNSNWRTRMCWQQCWNPIIHFDPNIIFRIFIENFIFTIKPNDIIFRIKSHPQKSKTLKIKTTYHIVILAEPSYINRLKHWPVTTWARQLSLWQHTTVWNKKREHKKNENKKKPIERLKMYSFLCHNAAMAKCQACVQQDIHI